MEVVSFNKNRSIHQEQTGISHKNSFASKQAQILNLAVQSKFLEQYSYKSSQACIFLFSIWTCIYCFIFDRRNFGPSKHKRLIITTEKLQKWKTEGPKRQHPCFSSRSLVAGEAGRVHRRWAPLCPRLRRRVVPRTLAIHASPSLMSQLV